jgi:hypothetical protein
LEQLKARACASARFQEGEEPSEDSLALLNRTNASSELEPSLTITDAIARRDALRMRRRFVADVADARPAPPHK